MIKKEVIKLEDCANSITENNVNNIHHTTLDHFVLHTTSSSNFPSEDEPAPEESTFEVVIRGGLMGG